MLRVMFKLVLINGGMVVLALPFIAHAQQDINSGLTGVQGLFGLTVGIPRGQGVTGLISWVIRILLIFSGIIAVIMVLISGFQYMTAGGNSEKASKAQQGVTNAIIGLVIVILSYVIVSAVVNTLLFRSGIS